jgi:hypothetical protein
MAAELARTNASIWHPGAKGTATELRWKDVFTTYLPMRYNAAKAFIVDCTGKQSDEIDLVVFDRHFTPLLFSEGDSLFIPAESVYAIFEVKPELSASTIRYASRKAASVRKLRRTSVRTVHAGGVNPPREPFPIVAGILATRASWTSSFEARVAASLTKLTQQGHLDLGCALRHGAFDAARDVNELVIETGKSDYALAFFFIRLLSRLQSLGTVPAMDLKSYSTGLRQASNKVAL